MQTAAARSARATVMAVVLALVATPSPALAWGAAAHRYLMLRAIDLLPDEIRPFFDASREELVWRVNDPDLWRVVGWDEAPHHFLDFGAKEYGAYPFAALPRDYSAAVERFGTETIRRYGLLPWRTAEMSGDLRRTFESIPRRAPFAAGNVVVFASAVAHYVQDAHQPLHATIDYDGQAPEQRGLHARFETDLFERYHTRLAVTPAAPRPLASVRDAVFDVLLESYQAAPRLFAADRAAAKSGRTYDDRYYDALFAELRALLERRLADAASMTASAIMTAWIDAGRPVLVVHRQAQPSR